MGHSLRKVENECPTRQHAWKVYVLLKCLKLELLWKQENEHGDETSQGPWSSLATLICDYKSLFFITF